MKSFHMYGCELHDHDWMVRGGWAMWGQGDRRQQTPMEQKSMG
jgi:hypothetical protein